MDEKQKKTLGVIFCMLMFVFMLLAQSIVYNREVRRADSKADALERELVLAGERTAYTQRQLEDSRRTIGQCYASVERITDNTREQSDELSGIIAELKTVREEVKNMEDALRYFYIKYGSDNNSFDNSGEVEE